MGNSLSIIFASGGFASSLATGGISLITISTVALLIHGWMKHKDLDLKIQNCTYAHQSYQHLLNEIKDIMRSGNFNSSHIYNTMKNIDDYVTDNSAITDKYLIKYDEKFIDYLSTEFYHLSMIEPFPNIVHKILMSSSTSLH